MYGETRNNIGAISKPMFITDIGQHWADMCNILFQYVANMIALLDISEIFVQYCPDITETLLLHQK